MSDWLDLYKSAGERHNMCGLHRREAGQNEIANTIVIRRLSFKPSDVVVDVGCGDGWMLAHLPPVARRIGIAPSAAEVAALEEYHDGNGIEFMRGLSSKLPLPDNVANVLVCNSVLFQLPHLNDLKSSIREFYRVAAPGATVFVGEMPTNHTPRNSVRALRLIKRVATNGTAEIVAAMRRRLAPRVPQSEKTVVQDQPRPLRLPYLRLRPDQMCAIAKRSGFKVEAVERWTLTLDGVTYPHATDRYNYLLRKPRRRLWRYVAQK